MSFSQSLQIPVGLMSLVTRVGLLAEDRLGLWSSALTDSPRVQSPSSQAEPPAGRAGTAVGLLQSGWSVWRRQLAVRPRDCWCPVCPCRVVTVSGEAWPLSWGQDGTSDSLHPHPPTPLQIVACGCWQLPGLRGYVKHQPPCSRSAETPPALGSHTIPATVQVIPLP